VSPYAGRARLESVPTLGEWVLNSLPNGDAPAAGRAGSVSPGRADGGRWRDGTPASVRARACLAELNAGSHFLSLRGSGWSGKHAIPKYSITVMPCHVMAGGELPGLTFNTRVCQSPQSPEANGEHGA